MNDTLSGLVGGGAVIPTIVAAFLVLGYFAVIIDRRRDTSPSRDDTQVGIKLVLFSLVITGLLIVVGGLQELFAYVLGGFKPTEKLKTSGANLVAGGFVALGVVALALPRTNSRAMPQVERFALGVVALFTGLTMVAALNDVIRSVFMGEVWAKIAGQLSQLFANAVVAILTIARLGRLSGWGSQPQAYAQPGAQPYQQQPGYAPSQPGYGQQGGYSPPGGGFPPQGYQR